jgi:hypothetical protein
MLGSLRKSSEQLQALDRIRDWTRERFGLNGDDTLLVTEVACQLPGCPPLETVVAFWTEAGQRRHHFKVFKPAAQVLPEDLPYSWMKDGLVEPEGFACNC